MLMFSAIFETVVSQYKIPLAVSGSAGGVSIGFDNSVFSVTGQNTIGLTSDANNRIYFGLLAPLRYVLTDTKLIGQGSNQLFQNYPNPFRQQTSISFEISKSSKVKLTVIDILGQQVDLLLDQELPVGKHTVFFNAENVNPGLYFYRLETGDFWLTKNMILTK
jgi:hypothetical protein